MADGGGLVKWIPVRLPAEVTRRQRPIGLLNCMNVFVTSVKFVFPPTGTGAAPTLLQPTAERTARARTTSLRSVGKILVQVWVNKKNMMVRCNLLISLVDGGWEITEEPCPVTCGGDKKTKTIQ